MPDSVTPLDLDQFLPYRLSVLANRVSRGFARLYQRRFDLKLPEWRVMAVLGRSPGLSAGQVAAMTAMDKVAISRALARLQRMGRVAMCSDSDDRRRQTLRLSDDGLAIYRQILPLARRLEASLLDGVDGADLATLDRLLRQLTAAAERIDPV